MNCGVTIMIEKQENKLSLLADLENAGAGAEQNSINIEDVTEAVLELGELLAEQDDAIVEIAGLIE